MLHARIRMSDRTMYMSKLRPYLIKLLNIDKVCQKKSAHGHIENMFCFTYVIRLPVTLLGLISIEIIQIKKPYYKITPDSMVTILFMHDPSFSALCTGIIELITQKQASHLVERDSNSCLMVMD